MENFVYLIGPTEFKTLNVQGLSEKTIIMLLGALLVATLYCLDWRKSIVHRLHSSHHGVLCKGNQLGFFLAFNFQLSTNFQRLPFCH